MLEKFHSSTIFLNIIQQITKISDSFYKIVCLPKELKIVDASTDVPVFSMPVVVEEISQLNAVASNTPDEATLYNKGSNELLRNQSNLSESNSKRVRLFNSKIYKKKTFESF